MSLPPTFLRTTLFTNELIGNVIVRGAVNLSSNLEATYFIGNGSQLSGLDQATLPSTGHIDVIGNLTGDSANVGTLAVSQTAYFTGQVNVIGNMSTQGMIYGSALNTTGNVEAEYFLGNGALLTGVTATLPSEITADVLGNVTATGNVAAEYFLGNGALLTGISAASIPSEITADVLGNVTATGNVSAEYFLGNGALLTGIVFDVSGNLSVDNMYVVGNVDVSNNVNVAGNVISDYFIGNGALLSGIDTYVLPSEITADVLGNVTATGNVEAAYFLGNGALLSGIDTYVLPSEITADVLGNVTATGNVEAAYFIGNGALLTGLSGIVANVSGNITVQNIHVVGNVDVSNNVNVAGNVITGKLFTSHAIIGNIDSGRITSGNITAAEYFLGNGAFITGIDTYVLPSEITADVLGNVTATNNVTAPSLRIDDTAYFQLQSNNAILAFDANDYLEYVRPTNSLNLNISANTVATFDSQGDLDMLGNVSAEYFLGNGALLTGVTATLPSEITADVLGNVTATGNVSAEYFLGNGALLTGVAALNASGMIEQTNLDGFLTVPQGYVANVTVRLALGGGALPVGSLARQLDDGNAYLLTAQPSNIDANWIQFTGVNFPVNTVFGRTGDILSTYGDYLDDTIELSANVGTVLAGNSVSEALVTIQNTKATISNGQVEASIIGNVVASGNVVAAYFVGNGSQLSGVTSTLPDTAAIDITGNVTAAGNVAAEYFLGNGALLSGIETYALPSEITADVLGNVIATGNVAAEYFLGNGSQLTGLAQYVLPSSANIDIRGNVTATGNVSAAHFLGNGSQLTGVLHSIPAALNVTSVTATDYVNATNFYGSFFQSDGLGDVAVFTGDGANLTGVLHDIPSNLSVTSVISVSGNIGNVLLAGGNVTASNISGNSIFANTITFGVNANVGKLTGLYCVAMNGNDSTADGSHIKPFLTIQAAHDRALSEYPPAADGTLTKQVEIRVAAGTFTSPVNITRYNTVIRGAGSLFGRGAYTSIGQVTVNCANAAYVFNNTVCLDRVLCLNGVTNTGNGVYTLNIDSCYLTASNATPLTADNDKSFVYVNDTFVSAQLGGGNTYVRAIGNILNFYDCTIQAATGAGTSQFINVGGNCAITLERCFVNPVSSTNAVIKATSSVPSAGAGFKINVTNSYIQNSGGPGIDFGTTNTAGSFIRDTTAIVSGNSLFVGNGFAYYNQITLLPSTSNTKATTVTVIPYGLF
jgi:hypothetical protein